MSIYFIRAGEDGPIKIGTAENVPDRMKELQCGNHLELTLLRTLDGGRPTEHALHRRYEHLRSRGEWFAFTPDMLVVEIADLGAEPIEKTSKLRAWLAKNDLSETEFAARIGVDQKTVNLYCRSLRIPRIKIMHALVAATNGEIQPDDFYDLAPRAAE